VVATREQALHSLRPVEMVSQLINRYDITKAYTDGSNPAFIRSLKISLGEYEEYDKVIEQAKREKVDFGE